MDGSMIPAFVTALAGTLTGGGIVAFLLKDRLDEQRQLRADYQRLRKDVDEKLERQIADNQKQLIELNNQLIRQQVKLEHALRVLDGVDFGVIGKQLELLNKSVENLIQAGHDESVDLAAIRLEINTLKARMDRAHEKIDVVRNRP